MKISILLCLTSLLIVATFAGDNKSITSNKYESAQYLPVFSNGMIRFIDSTGTVLNIPPFKTDYNRAELSTFSDLSLKSIDAGTNFRFHEGMILVKSPAYYFWEISDNYICYDNKGIELFKVESNLASYFSEDLLPISVPRKFLFIIIGYKFGYMDHSGKFQILPEYDFAGPFSEGISHVLKDGKYGYISKEGKIVIKPEYQAATMFSDSLAAVCLNGKYGYINKTGNFIITPVYDHAWPFKCGRARVLLNNKYNYIDKTGEFISEPAFEYAYDFSENIAAVKLNGKYGYINPNGNFILDPVYQSAGNFSSGLAPVELESKYGYINNKGMVVIPLNYQLAGNFENGLGVVWKDNLPFYINSAGKIIAPLMEDRSR